VGNVSGEGFELASVFPADASVSRFDPQTQAWQERLPSSIGILSDAPARLGSAESVLAKPATSNEAYTLSPELKIRYYHQDHIGSTTSMSDACGQPEVEESYYPFGHPRVRKTTRVLSEDFGFTQKETDGETDLGYFEARYALLGIARFCGVDPAQLFYGTSLYKPQRLNSYSYACANPLRYVDPTGAELGEPGDLGIGFLGEGSSEGSISGEAGSPVEGEGETALGLNSTDVGESNPSYSPVQDPTLLPVLLPEGADQAPIGFSEEGEVYIHYGPEFDAQNGLKPGSHANPLDTSPLAQSGPEAQDFNNLPRDRPPPTSYYIVKPTPNTPRTVPATVMPAYGRDVPGLRTETLFPFGTGAGTVKGPFPIGQPWPACWKN
jgi:RHS repeat-associated protein